MARPSKRQGLSGLGNGSRFQSSVMAVGGYRAFAVHGAPIRAVRFRRLRRQSFGVGGVLLSRTVASFITGFGTRLGK